MDVLLPLKALTWPFGVIGQEKSFAANPILGSPRLNRLGLHRFRVKAAARLTEMRRRALAPFVPAADREAFDRDGFVCRPDHLPPEVFAAVTAEVFGRDLPAWEMRQGQTVTRMIPLTEGTRPLLPRTVAAVREPSLRALTGYVAGRGGAPIHFIQTVIAEPHRGAPDAQTDPQTDMHSDTFHATAKFWLFLRDVGEEDGPFLYVPGSHRLTPARLGWEYAQSLSAAGDPRAHHRFGSFRIRSGELAALGLPPPRRMAVKANTLVIADTYGFHARSVSHRATLRVELHGHLRRNPFVPWNGLDALDLPLIRGRALDIHLALLRHFGQKGRDEVWHDVGLVRADAPACI
jgi:hypothetical protein